MEKGSRIKRDLYNPLNKYPEGHVTLLPGGTEIGGRRVSLNDKTLLHINVRLKRESSAELENFELIQFFF